MIEEIQLLSGIDIPFEEGCLIIHQPTLKEISYIGEKKFFYGCELLKFSKDTMLNNEDRNCLTNYTDFDILMSIIKSPNQDKTIKENVDNAFLVLNLIFPNYQIEIDNDRNYLKFTNVSNQKNIGFINSVNFFEFKKILNSIFCLKDFSTSEEYNPSGNLAKKIAKKLQDRQKKLAEIHNTSKQKELTSNRNKLFILYIVLNSSLILLFLGPWMHDICLYDRVRNAEL